MSIAAKSCRKHLWLPFRTWLLDDHGQLTVADNNKLSSNLRASKSIKSTDMRAT